MRSVLIIGSEAHPFAKTGGLADVLGALPPALARLGWDVTLVLPKYRSVAGGTLVERFPLTVGGYAADIGFFEAPLAGGARAILVDAPELYDRAGLYGVGNTDYPDNALRFAVLARAALEFVGRRGPQPSVVHAHDWQAGLAPVYLKTLYASHPVLAGTPSVFTIHNLAYQGLFDPAWLPRLGLPWDLFAIDRLEFWGKISFLKGGINDAEIITTVSPRYAEEIRTPEFGSGFDGILRRHAADLVGILNGIDTNEWDPANDKFLPAPFDAGDLSGKQLAKAELLSRYRLAANAASLKRPVIGMISRMVDQKGFDLVAGIASELPGLGAAWAVLGTGEPRYQDLWQQLAARHPDRIGARIGFDDGLAHLIEGGADIFLMPSRFEPCGLNQMYSLRYGTVPVVRAVGGLADTVFDVDLDATLGGENEERTPQASARPAAAAKSGANRAAARKATGAWPAPKRSARTLASQPSEGGLAEPQPQSGLATPKRSEAANGFVFQEYTPDSLLATLRRALTAFKNKRKWRALQLAGMKQDHSWDRSAREYVRMYERVSRTRD